MDGLDAYLGVTGENSGEVVTPAPETENTETVTDTEDESGTQEGEEAVVESPESTEDTEDESHVQTPEQRSKWAEMRREAERAKALEVQIQQDQVRRDQFYADKFGKSHGIFTEAQYHAALERTQQEQAQQQAFQPVQQMWNDALETAKKMQDEGYGDTYVNAWLNQQRTIVQQQERQIRLEQRIQQDDFVKQQEVKAREDTAFKQRLVSQYEQLTKEFPDMVKKPDDIIPEVWQEFEATGRRDLVKAFKLANFEKLVSRNNKAAKQAALNSVNSKQHLKPDGGSGEVYTVVVPPEILRQYRALNKTWTDEQIAADYRKHNPKRR